MIEMFTIFFIGLSVGYITKQWERARLKPYKDMRVCWACEKNLVRGDRECGECYDSDKFSYGYNYNHDIDIHK